MKGLFTVEERTSSAVVDLVMADEYRAHIPDVFRGLLKYCYDTRGTYCDATLSYDNRLTWRTRVKPNPSLLDNLAMFFEVLSTQAAPSATNTSQSSWHSRERVGLTGVMYPGSTTQHHYVNELYNFLTEDIGTIEFTTLLTPHGEYMSADHFFDFAQQVVKTCGNGFTARHFCGTMITNQFEVVGSGPLTHFEITYTNMSCTVDRLSYSVEIKALGTLDPFTGKWYGTKTRYDSSISRDKNMPWCLVVDQTAAWSITSYDVINESWDSPPSGGWHSDTRVSQLTRWRDGNLPESYKNVLDYVPVSIMACAPALYHTQSRAYASLLGKVSENFESLIESPDFLGTLFQVAKASTAEISSFMPPGYMSVFSKVKFLIHLVCGAYITWIFALSPALKSARDAYERFLKDARQAFGKGSISFEGDESDFEELPTGLRDLLQRIVPDDTIVGYKVRFGSQLYAQPADDKMTSLVEKIVDDAARLGIEPNPVYLYQMQPFTFVIDWFVPVGALLQDAYNRYKITHTRGVVAGHSVSVDLTLTHGLTVKVFLRSEATVLMIDPQMDSWLTTSVPAVVAVPLAAVLLL